MPDCRQFWAWLGDPSVASQLPSCPQAIQVSTLCTSQDSRLISQKVCQFGFSFELRSYTDNFHHCETPSSFSYVNKSHTFTSQDSPALLALLFHSVESSQVSDSDFRSVPFLLFTWVFPGLILLFKALFTFMAHSPLPFLPNLNRFLSIL